MSRPLGLASFVAFVLFVVACAHNESQTVPISALPLRTAANARAAIAPRSPIRHVVIIIQENRSVDNLFNGFPGADTVKSGLTSTGRSVALHPADLDVPYDPSHEHADFLTEFNGGKMNGFDLEHSQCPSCTPPPDAAYAYVPEDQVRPYWTMARSYAFADHMFQTNEGQSFPAHQYLISGTSAVGASATLSAMDNPGGISLSHVGGCDSPSGSTVQLINPTNNDQSQQAFPCFEHQTLMDTLDAASVTWRYYQFLPAAGLWNAVDAIRHLRQGAAYANVIVPSKQILSDIADDALASVVWVTPTAATSDHAGATTGTGPAWVASIVNAVGESSYWSSTAIFVVWDDWGGWFDHASPEQFNYYELGFRVPLIAISPYARSGYVSHVQHEFGSILKFVEKTYALPSLGYTDARADDLGDMFDFERPPLAFKPIPSATVAPSALTDRRDPDDDR